MSESFHGMITNEHVFKDAMSDEDIWVWELMHDMKTFTINSEMQAYTKLFSSIIVVFLFDYLDAKWTARNVIQLKRKRRHEHTKNAPQLPVDGWVH